MNTRESLFSFLDHSSSIYYIITDSHGIYTYANSLFRKIFGYLSHDISTKEFSAAIHPDDLSIYHEAIQECIQKRDKTVCVDLRHPRFDGSLFWTRWEFSPITEGGKAAGIQCIGNDISERKRAELEKLQAQENLQLLMNNTEESFMMVGKDLQILSYNAAANQKINELYNVTLKKGLSILALGPPERHEFLKNLYKDVFEGKDHETEVRFPNKNGSSYIYSNHFKPAYSENKEIVAAVITSRDITEKKTAEEKLIHNEKHFRSLIENSAEGLAILSSDGIVLEMSPSGEKILGYFTSELGDIHRADIIHPEDIFNVKLLFEEVAVTPASLKKIEYRIKTAHGNLIWIACTYHNLIEEPGIHGIVLNFRDITEQKEADQALQVSEEQYRFLFHLNPQPMWIYDADTLHFLEVNEAAVQHYGYSAAEFHKMTIRDIQPSDDATIFPENPDRPDNEKERSFSNLIWSHRKKNGDTIFVEIKSNELHYNGRLASLVLANDITEKVKAEEELARERYLLRTLIDHLPDYIYVKDSQFRHIINNKANVELMGAKDEKETLGKTVLDYFDRDVAEKYIQHDRQVMEKGQAIHNLEEAILTHGNKKRWLLTTKVPLKDENNKVFGIVGVSRDITAQKEIAESLRISNERFNMVSKATNDAIWDWDLVTNEILWNKAIKHLFGYKDPEIGKTADWWYEKIHPEDRERVVSKIHHHIDSGIEKWQDEYRFVKADGTYKFVLDRGFILLNNEQKPYRMIGAMMDITERKKLEAELAEQKINKQREITEATIQAQEKERSELGKELHDNINQILSTTKLYIDMALTETDIREELLQKTYRNISSAIEEIRMLSKSLVPPSLGDIGLKEAVSELVASLNISQRVKLTLKTTGIEMVTMPDNIKLMAYRIVQEQVNNIIKHSRATTAEIKLAVSKKMFNITVKDNGIGFDSKRKSNGIGLSNITSRAELHNGKVEVVSSPGKGCTLKVSLPF
jgi:two-component system sensor histidine kinase UhpB